MDTKEHDDGMQDLVTIRVPRRAVAYYQAEMEMVTSKAALMFTPALGAVLTAVFGFILLSGVGDMLNGQVSGKGPQIVMGLVGVVLGAGFTAWGIKLAARVDALEKNDPKANESSPPR